MELRGWLRRGSLLVIMSLFAMLLVAQAGVVEAAGVTNGDFEPDLTGWTIDSFAKNGNAQAATSLGAITPQHGTHFAAMNNPAGVGLGAFTPYAQIYQNISVLPGGTLSGYVYFIPDTSGGAPAQSARVNLFGAASVDVFTQTTATGGWVHFTYTFPAGSQTTQQLSLQLYCATNGACPNEAVGFDNITYTDPPSPTTTTTVTNATASYSGATQNVTLTANVAAQNTVNEGAVTFTVKDGSNNTVGSPVTSGTVSGGTATATFSLPGGTGAGTYTITAVYNPATPTPKFQGSSGTGTLTVSAVTLTGLAVGAPNATGNPPTIKVGQQAQLTATATFSDTSTANVAGQSQWSSSNGAIVRVDPATGNVTGESPGTATITATYTSGGVTKAGTITITVSQPTAIGIPAPAPQGRSAGNASVPTGPGGAGVAPAPTGR